jgi:hypothetical protein
MPSKRELSKARAVWELAARRGERRPDDPAPIDTMREGFRCSPAEFAAQ